MIFLDPSKVLMGIGRAVYESTNKAIFADFFPGEKSAGAERSTGINQDQR